MAIVAQTRMVRVGGEVLVTAYYMDTTGDLYTSRWSGTPEVIGAPVLVEASGVTSVGLAAGMDGRLHLAYCQAGAVKHRTSSDLGVTWSAATTVLAASNYNRLLFAMDNRGAVLHLWHTLNGTTMVTGTFDTVGALQWSGAVVTAPGPTLTTTYRNAAMWIAPTGRIEGGGGYSALVYATDLPPNPPSGSDWSAYGLLGAYAGWIATAGTYYLKCPAIDWRRGLMVFAGYKTGGGKWQCWAGALQSFPDYLGRLLFGQWHDVGGAPVSDGLYGPTDMVAAAEQAGDLLLRKDGVWEFAYTPAAGDQSVPAIVRCKDLRSDSSGVWS